MLAAIIAITSCGPDQNDPTLPEDSKEENVTENNTGLIDATICEYSGELIVICNSNEEPILMYELPRSSQRLSLFYSSAEIVNGESYKVYIRRTDQRKHLKLERSVR